MVQIHLQKFNRPNAWKGNLPSSSPTSTAIKTNNSACPNVVTDASGIVEMKKVKRSAVHAILIPSPGRVH